jgi:hypothetical protein
VKSVCRLLCLVAGLGVLGVSAVSANADNPYFRSVRRVSKKYLGSHSGDWKRCVYQTAQRTPSTLTCDHSVTVTASISASFGSAGFSDADISPTLGFNVSYSSTFGNGESWTMKRYESGWGDMGFRYNLYRIGMESRECPLHGSCLGWSSPTYGNVQQVLGDTYKFFPSKKKR